MKCTGAIVLGVALATVVSGCSGKKDTHPKPLVEDKGWFMSGGGRDFYTASYDEENTRASRPTIVLTRTTNALNKYGTWMFLVDATTFRGKRVRFSAYTKTSGTTARADFWARVQARDSPGDGSGLGGQWISLPAFSDWTPQEIVIDVLEKGHTLQYGVGVDGPGKLWLDQPRYEVVGVDVPVTVMKKE